MAARTADQITADIAVTRERLAGTIDQLVYRTKPKTIAQRRVSSLKASFQNESGGVRMDKIVKIAGAVVGLVVVIVAIRKIAG